MSSATNNSNNISNKNDGSTKQQDSSNVSSTSSTIADTTTNTNITNVTNVTNITNTSLYNNNEYLEKKYSVEYYIGMIIATCFTVVYFIAPFYIISGIYCIIVGYPNRLYSIVYCIPLVVSSILPCKQLPFIFPYLKYMCIYFQYEEIHETKPINVWDEILLNHKKYLCVCVPHGVISFAGMCSVATGRLQFDKFSGTNIKFPTAVADALLVTPILKHVLGIFGLISASKQSLQSIFRNPNKIGVNGCIILYVGGVAELFLSSANEEVLYLNNRKGFIKLALSEGIDIIPIYLFGNTSVLHVLSNNVLASLSRKTQISFTYIWGKYYLPIPRDCKLLYVSGQPLGMPHIKNPTNDDVNVWHTKYCNEVTRMFHTYKERVPEYKHKQLRIV